MMDLSQIKMECAKINFAHNIRVFLTVSPKNVLQMDFYYQSILENSRIHKIAHSSSRILSIFSIPPQKIAQMNKQQKQKSQIFQIINQQLEGRINIQYFMNTKRCLHYIYLICKLLYFRCRLMNSK
ncbi:hypothetical protein TTHERM_000985229 (macronuclear) [Tetrahymena thermophila SB210]|uniref:Uncharacterized protein n=1 Tax=Tetrahymena thermophila (strain SB210) TaxID=312017 RepID=W7XL03_TETTS|nr:hypothetical protein TTHERM_000985229 [Tetrahymena thermophila SB210]EWS75439.1 hypothetical protein TTHERM_000985229 [Tetrahymena thermophila SB210]|eukprot:XP_012652024.1 hypothetical protein TTHERM_000985229 [Tetrahymena thermophila SB210]